MELKNVDCTRASGIIKPKNGNNKTKKNKKLSIYFLLLRDNQQQCPVVGI
jgi:hypothetical protein